MTSLNYAASRNVSLLRKVGAFCLSDWRISAYSLIIVSLFLIILSNFAHGDDLTGLPLDDPKDLQPAATPTAVSSYQPQLTGGIAFQPLPNWSRGVAMPPLPYQLKPMGKKPVVEVTPPTPAPEPLAPPKDPTPTTQTAPAPTIAREKPAPAPAADTNPALITVSPFLQWIKSNPQAAAQARQQANSYQAATPPAPDAGSTNNAGNSTTAGNTGNVVAGSAGDEPYWLPPLLDSSDFETRPVTGSAAIYQTPQR